MGRHFTLSFRSSALPWLLLLLGGLIGCQTATKDPSADLAYADMASLHRLPPVQPSEMFTPSLAVPRPGLDDVDLVALAEQRAAARARSKRRNGVQQAAGTS